ncbi:MAG: ATP-dependent RecD-like DNA helicase [Kiritimatiellae bacterium]|nr:ATP-dependent RecD-like DNA helicase [Kiritimatiellia bacterium]
MEQKEHINGPIERVTFHSEESGFCVLRVKVKGHREQVTMTGFLPQVTAGEWVDAHGQWVVDPKYGQQFKASTLRTTYPDTPAGIEKYLGSGLIKGIGPVCASKLVQKFGRDIFDVMETRSKLLEKVSGIGPHRRQQIKVAWNEQKSVREIMTFLLSHGVTTTRAFRIHKTYGDDAIPKVQRDPYCLARDIPGIGFLTADQIASNMGVEKTSELRAKAGTEYALQACTSEGHCAYPQDELIEKTSVLLEVPPALIQKAIEQAIHDKRLILEKGLNKTPLIYLAHLHYAEKSLAQYIKELLQGTHPCPHLETDKVLTWVQNKLGFDLAPSQHQALISAITSKVMIITGGPGVGKTTLISAILKIFKAKDLNVILCAPTGRAAKRMAEATGTTAKTIHRLLVYDPAKGHFKHNETLPLKGDVFIVDETSMIDLVLAHQLVRAIPSHATLIFVGDVDQLPSVGPGSVLGDIIQSETVPVYRLNKIFRQAAESSIIINAHRINEGQPPLYREAKQASDFYFVKADDPEKACEKISRLVQESIPKKFHLNPLNDIQIITPMQRGELGARNLNQLLQKTLNPDGASIQKYGTDFRVGDKVMQRINNYDKDIFNGDVGRIFSLNVEECELVVEFGGRNTAYDFQELDELMLAYATTIHKSQGSEYPCVIIPIHTQHYILLQRNLLYTAITRGKKLVLLVGSEKAIAIAIQKIEARKRITMLKERLTQRA